MPKLLLFVLVLTLLNLGCSLKLDQHTSNTILKVSARNTTYAILSYAPDLTSPLKLFLNSFRLALDNKQEEALQILETEAWTYLQNRFAHNPMLLQDIKDLYQLIQLEADFTPYQKYSSVIDGALSAIYLFEEY